MPHLQTGAICRLDVTFRNTPITPKSPLSATNRTWQGQLLDTVLRVGLCSALKDRTRGSERGKHLLGSPDHAGLWNHRARRRSLHLGLRYQACVSLRRVWVVQVQVAELERLLGVKD